MLCLRRLELELLLNGYLMRCIFQIWKTVWMSCKFSLPAPRGHLGVLYASVSRDFEPRTLNFITPLSHVSHFTQSRSDYSPTSFLISARNDSRRSTAQASSRANK